MLKHQFRAEYFSAAYRPQILEIERLSFDRPWTVTRLSDETRPTGRSSAVALHQGDPVGYVLFSVARGRPLSILRLAVHPSMRRRGVGRFLVELGLRRGRELECSEITANVPERAVGMQMLLRACGMRCGLILRGWDEETGEDLYRFEWSATAAVAGKEVAA